MKNFFNKIDEFPWWAQFDAYGFAIQSHTSQSIKDLCSKNEDTWGDAVNDRLWGNMCHQYTLYSIVPYAIPFIVEAMSFAVPDCRYEILHFVKVCAQIADQRIFPSPIFEVVRRLKGIKKQTVRSAIVSCRTMIESFKNDPDKRVRDLASWLVEYCVV